MTREVRRRKLEYQRDYRRRAYWRDPDRARRTAQAESYGMTLAERDALFEAAAGRCMACRQRPERVLRVDHDHLTGRVRGLLCAHCNTALGMVGDDPERLRALITYVESRP